MQVGGGGGSPSFDGGRFMFIFRSLSIEVHEWCPLKSDREDSGISRVTAFQKGGGGVEKKQHFPPCDCRNELPSSPAVGRREENSPAIDQCLITHKRPVKI